jgi:Protein of unknown function (DUF2891)
MTAPRHLTSELADRFARLALGHVGREYPHKLDHVLAEDGDALPPRALHPIFFGSFDWHSCVHGYWLLARLYRRFPAGEAAGAVRAQLDQAFTPQKVAGELAYLARPLSRGFERPYGWAWLLMLAAELTRHQTDEGRRWAAALRPLAEAFAERFCAHLPLADYPVRAGVHTNTAFALVLASDYARVAGDHRLDQLLRARALDWYGADADCQAWEPSGDDFLSSALIEALCMQRMLDPTAFHAWFAAFLPRVAQRSPASLFAPAKVADRSDGKIAHLDGLNLSRAWCWREIAVALDAHDPARLMATEAADRHLEAGLPHVAGDYMGEHWLASFALLALEAPL